MRRAGELYRSIRAFAIDDQNLFRPGQRSDRPCDVLLLVEREKQGGDFDLHLTNPLVDLPQ